MDRLWPQISFALIMLTLGFLALWFPERIISLVEKAGGSRVPFYKWINPSHVVPSIRSGGVIGVLIGLFVLWATWRSL